LLCQQYGKNVPKFKDPKFITKLLAHIEKRKTKKKKDSSDKGAFGLAKGIFNVLTNKKAPALN
jgi:hypothetical protein